MLQMGGWQQLILQAISESTMGSWSRFLSTDTILFSSVRRRLPVLGLVLVALVAYALWRSEPKLSALLMQLHFIAIRITVASELLLSPQRSINSVALAKVNYSEMRLSDGKIYKWVSCVQLSCVVGL